MRTPQFSELKTARERVHLLLKEMPKLRESDDDLIATYIFKEVGEEIKEMTALDLLAKMSNSKLTPFATIIRARQDPLRISVSGAGITSEVTSAMNALGPKDKVLFDDIIASGPDGSNRRLNSVIISVQ
jgi:hypothetical protein